jgi:hypothetical protein
MPAERMSKQQFQAKVRDLDEDRLRKVLWTLYWRGPAPVRQRIEAELDPAEAATRRNDPEPLDPEAVLAEVREFATLARAGAYMAGDRRVSPKQRTRWRFTFRRLADEAEQALRTDDLDTAADAVALLVDLACQTMQYDYFRSDDPMQAAGFVVSDTVERLWLTLRDRYGFAVFAERAAPQLIRWESAYGWTRYGTGSVAEKERSLAQVLAGMLTVPDHWSTFAERYVESLDERARASGTRKRRSASSPQRDRTRALAEWHELLRERLAGSEAEGLLDRLASTAPPGRK